MKNLPIIVLAIGSLMFARGVPCASGYEYTVIDIGVLPQSVYSNAMAINDVGQVVGRSRVDIGFGLTAQRAFIWDAQNGIQNLGVLPGYTSSTANDINDYGQVVGWCQAGAGDERAFIWSFVDGMVDIGEGIAYGINNDGIVVGHTGYEGTAFSWDPNGQQTLELPLGFSISRAWGINDSGVIVGNVGDSRAVKWDPILGVLDLGVDGGAKCINDTGQIAGFYEGQSQALFWDSNSTIIEIPESGHGYGINDYGQVVGQGDGGAFLWDIINGTQNLNDLINPSLGWSLQRGYDINELGQIVGFGTTNGETHAFLLLPTHEPTVLTIQTVPNYINSVIPPIGQHFAYAGWFDISAQKLIDCPDTYRFDYWDGDVADPNSANTTVLMDADKTVTAVFIHTRECGDECHPNFLLGDLNHDCIVDLGDIVMVASRWLTCSAPECD